MERFKIFKDKVEVLSTIIRKTDLAAVISIEFMGGLVGDLNYIEEELFRLDQLED